MTPRELFDTYGAFVWRTLKYQSVAERDLDDVGQEVFLTIFRRLPEYEPHASLRWWIYGICVRTASDYRKRAHHHREILVHELPDVGPQAASSETDRLTAKSQLIDLLERLDEEKRAVFVLYEIENIPMDEIALIVKCPVKTAYSRLAAAKKQMLQMLAKSDLVVKRR
jgi:RNA polymerase sigma-70 factor, ECF subfamily